MFAIAIALCAALSCLGPALSLRHRQRALIARPPALGPRGDAAPAARPGTVPAPRRACRDEPLPSLAAPFVPGPRASPEAR